MAASPPRTSGHVQALQSAPGRASVVMGGKKGGKKKGGKSKKGGPKKSGFEWASNFTNKPFEAAALRELVETAASGYRAKIGSPLHASLEGSMDVPKAVWKAPIACMITKPAEAQPDETADPSGSICVYANSRNPLHFDSIEGGRSSV